MLKFDTKVQHLKYKVLREVAREAFHGTLTEHLLDIPKTIVPGKVPTMRCCVYKERAILAERVKIAMGGDPENPNVIQVIDIACDECPAAGYSVTDSCRGCLAHRCGDACKRNAITYDANHVAHIDKSLCVECGACSKVCPYTAIINRKRPCQNACKVKAITINEDGAAAIRYEKCIQCGSCVYQCPFGAITDKSFILDAVELLKNVSEEQKVIAMVAPSIASQFSYTKPGQVVAGLRALGFSDVIETALGADMVAMAESKEFAEKGFLTTSCCPAFVRYVKTAFPDLAQFVSHNPSPMAALGKFIKETIPGAKVVFIGPCTAKKAEAQLEDVKPYVDVVITFEELQALFDARDIDLATLEPDLPNQASYFGRIFAHSGGVASAVKEALQEQNIDVEVKPSICDGIEECKLALLRKSKGVLAENFIEGMACVGGCIGGAGCLTHGEKNRAAIEKYGDAADAKTIQASLDKINK